MNQNFGTFQLQFQDQTYSNTTSQTCYDSFYPDNQNYGIYLQTNDSDYSLENGSKNSQFNDSFIDDFCIDYLTDFQDNYSQATTVDQSQNNFCRSEESQFFDQPQNDFYSNPGAPYNVYSNHNDFDRNAPVTSSNPQLEPTSPSIFTEYHPSSSCSPRASPLSSTSRTSSSSSTSNLRKKGSGRPRKLSPMQRQKNKLTSAKKSREKKKALFELQVEHLKEKQFIKLKMESIQHNMRDIISKILKERHAQEQ